MCTYIIRTGVSEYIILENHLCSSINICAKPFYTNRVVIFICRFSDVVKVGAEELKPALSYCTHLVYGYVGFDDDKFKAKSLEPKLDLPESKDVKGGRGNLKSITALKKAYPSLTILLSVGGNADTEDPDKYLTVVSTYILIRWIVILLLDLGRLSAIVAVISPTLSRITDRCT